jgi:hypothetical protein
MLDRDLAALYGVETRVLNQAVKRHQHRFPSDFMFQLTEEEADGLVSRNVIPHKKYFGGHRPRAFTQEGVAMLSSVLNSARAVQVNIAVMRAFVKMRETLSADKDLAKTLAAIERRLAARGDSIGENVAKIAAVLTAIKRLMEPEAEVPEVPLS